MLRTENGASFCKRLTSQAENVAAALTDFPGATGSARCGLPRSIIGEAEQTGVVQQAIDAKGLKGVNVATK